MYFSDDLDVAFKVHCPKCNWVGWSADCLKELTTRHKILVCPHCLVLVLPVWRT